jgi:hypothetical protein
MAVKVSKLNLWLKYFLDESCSTTFLNKKESARKANYNCTTEDSLRNVGHQNFIKLADKIEKWLDEHGLSENSLKIKLISLLNAKETKFLKVKGAIKQENLAPGCIVLGTSGEIETTKDGISFGDGDTLIAVETEAIETQRKTLETAMKFKGMFREDNIQKGQGHAVIRISRTGGVETATVAQGEEDADE